MSAALLREGVTALEAELAGGPTARIAAALMRMISVTRRPASMDDDRAKLYFDTIQEALMDYPVDVVEDALVEWRKGASGEWWPAEAELRRVCDRLFAPRCNLLAQAVFLLREAERREEREARAQHPSAFAGERQRRFREAMRRTMTPARFAAYFDPARVRYAGDDTILVRSLVAEHVLCAEGGEEAASLGIAIRYAPEEFAGAPLPNVAMSDEDHAYVAAGMTRLAQRMRGGAAPVNSRETEDGLRRYRMGIG